MTASALLVTLLNVSMYGCKFSLHPCSCKYENSTLPRTTIGCDKISSYSEMYNAINGRFNESDGKVTLKITYANLQDLPFRSFKELNMSIDYLSLNHDRLTQLNETTFEGLDSLKFFSLADNYLEKVPNHIWKHVPNVGTLDLGRQKLTKISENDFKDLPNLDVLLLPGNYISEMDRNSIPSGITKLHIGRNLVSNLNGTLKNLTELNWLFMNANNLTDIEGELPLNTHKLKMIHASSNRLLRLPSSLRTVHGLDTLFLDNNELTSLDGHIAPLKELVRLQLNNNKINILHKDEFKDCVSLVNILMASNNIKHLNNSLLGLKNLRHVILADNDIEEFSFHEISGLEELVVIDLSYNRISTLIGPTSNLLEWNIHIHDLDLQHNRIETLNGSLSGLRQLTRLNLAYNKLKKIAPDDLLGLDQLVALDISHNFLTSLEETSKTFLPRLQELKASHNYLTILDKDFHGLPVLCKADFESNQIVALGRELVSKTKCICKGDGVCEGTYDTLRIILQGNPILCDAALPEISAVMEINHTKIEGVPHCPRLIGQAYLSKQGYLGYYQPSTTTSKPKPVVPLEPVLPTPEVQQVPPQTQENRPLNQEGLSNTPSLIVHEIANSQTHIKKNMDKILVDVYEMASANDSSKLSKLESEIEHLKNKVDLLATQLEADGQENKKV